MKSLFLVALICALGSCYGAEFAEHVGAQERSASSELLRMVEYTKVIMRNGSPEYGIPVMAPMTVAKKSVKLSTGDFSFEGEIEDFVLQGLDEFETIIMNVDLIRSRITAELQWASLNFTTKYKADVGTGYRMQREGGAFFALEDLNIRVRINYSLGVLSNKVAVKNVLVYPSVGNVNSQIENLSKYRILNRKMNEVIEEFVTLTINDNTDFVADWVNELVTPICNDVIGDRTLSDLIGIITGGGN